MGLLGISLLVASVVYVIVRPPPWMPPQILRWRGLLGLSRLLDGPLVVPRQADGRGHGDKGDGKVERQPEIQSTRPHVSKSGQMSPSSSDGTRNQAQTPVLVVEDSNGADDDPPPPPPTIAVPDEEQTTPKATASDPPSIPVPSFTLSDDRPTPPAVMAPPPIPAPTSSRPHNPPASSMMMPPPLPPATVGRAPTAQTNGRPPSLAQFPAANSAQRARGPVPNRGPGGGLAAPSSGLAPPPTHSSKPKKPSRKVLLTPGHSPLDWARISGPNSDLRGVDPSTPYLRVTPSMLKKMTGRKGKDAWMALNGKVYNVTPYADFHPGGVPELMRGAGRDGTKLFGEIHPWVNYETMLSSCLVGLLVEESEGKESEMEQMD